MNYTILYCVPCTFSKYPDRYAKEETRVKAKYMGIPMVDDDHDDKVDSVGMQSFMTCTCF